MTKIKKNFITGFISLLPTFATLYVIIFAYKIIAGIVQLIVPIELISNLLVSLHKDLENVQMIVSFVISLISIGLMLFLIFFIGFGINTFVSKKTLKFIEGLIMKIPLAKSIYGSIKQVRDLLFSKNNEAYKKTVLVEYPKKGLYSLALVTKENNKNIERLLGQGEMYNIFISTAPNPTSGFYLIVNKKDCIELNVSVEETFKSIISVGAISPKKKMEE
jgi:uncharacterized membrane protein